MNDQDPKVKSTAPEQEQSEVTVHKDNEKTEDKTGTVRAAGQSTSEGATTERRNHINSV